MTYGSTLISASTNRLIILAAASLLLLAAGDVSQAVKNAATAGGPEISDTILAPVSAAEAAASAAALAATTPADVAAAYVAETATDPAAEAPALRPASLTHLIASIDDFDVADDHNLRCLATAVYFESRGEPIEGQLAVAQTILNRVESGRYAPSVCGVINQPRQFSYDRRRTPSPGRDWDIAQAIAKIAVDDMWQEVAPAAISFHAKRVSPNWAGKTRVATIGNHIFYR